MKVSQKVVMARRRLRRSLDRQPPPLDVPKLCDIVVPNSSFYSIPFEVSAGEASGLLTLFCCARCIRRVKCALLELSLSFM